MFVAAFTKLGNSSESGLRFSTLFLKNVRRTMTSINISGINKTDLLKALWTKSRVASFFALGRLPAPLYNEVLARDAVFDYIDYFQGRVIKSDLSGNTVNPEGYDRDNGEGSFKKIVDSVSDMMQRNKKILDNRGFEPLTSRMLSGRSAN